MPQPIPAPSTPSIAKPPASRCWGALKLAAGLLTFGPALDCPAPQRAMPKPEPLSTNNYVPGAPSRVFTPMDQIIAESEERMRSSDRGAIVAGTCLVGLLVSAGAAFRSGFAYQGLQERLDSTRERLELLRELTKGGSCDVHIPIRSKPGYAQSILRTFTEDTDRFVFSPRLANFDGVISVSPVKQSPWGEDEFPLVVGGFSITLCPSGRLINKERLWVDSRGDVIFVEFVYPERDSHDKCVRKYPRDRGDSEGRKSAKADLIAALTAIALNPLKAQELS